MGRGVVWNGVNYPMKNEVNKAAAGVALGIAMPGWLGVIAGAANGGIIGALSAYFAKNAINATRTATSPITSQLGGMSNTGSGSSPYGAWGQ